MKNVAITVLGAGALAALGLGLAGTAAAAGGADDVVNLLTTQGYSVQINGTPTANLSACTVDEVKKDAPGGANPTAYVNISCPTGC
jgi:hypothetical protein